MIPSSTAPITAVVSVFCIALSEPKRETMSPRCRFSKNTGGRRIRWANTLADHW
jgi:hypothetical protein